MKKLGLALGAGGIRGIAHIGILKALEEADIKVDYIAGSSSGAVVGSCYAGGMSTEKMLKIVQKLNVFSIIDLSLDPFRKGGLFRSKKYKELIRKTLPIKTYEHLKIPFCCVATDIVSGETVVLDSGNLAENVSASSAMPSIFRPVKQGDMLLIDGGIKCRVPVKQVRDMGADVVVGIDVLGQETKGNYKYNTLNVLLRAIDIADAQLALLTKDYTKPDLYIDFEMNGASQYKFKNIEEIYNKGYEVGKSNVETIKKLLCD